MPPVVSTPSLPVVVLGAIVPVFTYVLNRIPGYGAFPEPAKAFVQVLLVAVATGAYQAATNHGLGVNRTTLGYMLTAIVSALYAHGYLWKPADVNNVVGGPAVRDLTSEQRQALADAIPA